MKNKKELLILALFITDNCNMRCSYCFVKKSKKSMSLELAKKSIDMALGLGYENVIITFLGGEPLLEYEKIKKIINYSKERNVKRYNVATNGLLLNKSKLEYFCKSNVAVQFSFDGTEESQNMCRVKKDAKGSYALLKDKLELFSKYADKMHFEIRMTFSPKTVPHLCESINFLHASGFTNSRINLMPVVSCVKWEEDDFISLREQILKIKNLLKVKKVNLYLNECLGECSNVSKLSLEQIVPCNAGTRVLCVDKKGDAYPCFVYAGISDKKKKKYLLGNIETKFKLERGKQFAEKYKAEYLSCPTWNYFLGDRALETYKKVFNLWKELKC